jgi:hypothetical protein
MTIEVPVLATVGIPPQLAAIFTPSPMVNGWPSHDAMHENLVRLFRCQRCAKNCIQLAIKFVCRILDLQKILWKAREALAATAHDVWCLAEACRSTSHPEAGKH